MKTKYTKIQKANPKIKHSNMLRILKWMVKEIKEIPSDVYINSRKMYNSKYESQNTICK